MKVKTLTVLALIGLFITGCASTDIAEKSDLTGGRIERSNTGPFNGTKIVQIGIVVQDVEKYAKSYAEFFGVEVLAFGCRIEPDEISLSGPLPVLL